MTKEAAGTEPWPSGNFLPLGPKLMKKYFIQVNLVWSFDVH